MRHALALLTLVLFAVPAAAQPATVSLDDAVRGIEAEYGRTPDPKAETSQTSFNKSLSQTIPAAGQVYLKKGGKLRWEYPEPTQQVIVSDGKPIWLYTPQLNQVNTGPAPEALAGPAGSFLGGPCQLRGALYPPPPDPAQPNGAHGHRVLGLPSPRPLPTLKR